MLGSGRIFPYSQEDLTVEPFEIPKYWPRIGGLDFGIDHPFAAVELAHDRDSDTVYLTRCYRIQNALPVIHASMLRNWNLPWAWPHDGLSRDKASGRQIAQIYKDEGLEMLSEHAKYSDERKGFLEDSLMDLSQRMQKGQFKVFQHCHEFFEEFRTYHRKDGLVVKEHDDLISATRYALMMLRYARITEEKPVSDRYRGGFQRIRTWMAS